MVKKFYNLDKAIACTYAPEFLISHECNKAYDGGVCKREFFVFKNVNDYVSKMNLYPHSHEIIYRDSEGVVTGRLFFDFDFTKTVIRDNFKEVIEKLILATIEKYYIDINLSAITFVWQKTEYPDKHSRHLTVKGFHFDDDWVIQSKLFYDLFELEVKRSEELDYIQDENLIDRAPAKENTTMRMPWNSKIGKPNMEFEDDHTFFDGLIKLYQREDMSNEQSITAQNNNYAAMKACAPKIHRKFFEDEVLDKKIVKSNVKIPCHEARLKRMVFLRFQNTFDIAKIDGGRIDLLRTKPGSCFNDPEHYHEHENAFLFYDEQRKIYRFFCRRECMCNGKKFREIDPKAIQY